MILPINAPYVHYAGEKIVNQWTKIQVITPSTEYHIIFWQWLNMWNVINM